MGPKCLWTKEHIDPFRIYSSICKQCQPSFCKVVNVLRWENYQYFGSDVKITSFKKSKIKYIFCLLVGTGKGTALPFPTSIVHWLSCDWPIEVIQRTLTRWIWNNGRWKHLLNSYTSELSNDTEKSICTWTI